MPLSPVTLRLLGPVVVETGSPAAGRLSAVLALLALEAGRVVSVDRLMDQLWPDEPPASGAASLHVYVSRLRRLLEPTASQVVTRIPGYVLEVPRSAVDVHRLTDLLASAEAAASASDWAAVHELVRSARDLWRGDPFVGAYGCADLEVEAERLQQVRARVDELGVRALLGLDRIAEAVAPVEELGRRDPLNETYARLRMRTRYASGDVAGALEAYEEFRVRLADELGLDPGERIRRLQLELLRSEPAHDSARETAPATGPDSFPASPVSPATPAPALQPDTTRAQARLALEEALTGARDGAGRSVIVEGEPGMGKTFLAAHAAEQARAEDVRVVWARAGEGAGTPPWWLWEQVLESLAAQPDGGRHRPGASVLDELVDRSSDDDLERSRFRLCLALIEQILAVAAREPLLVVLDDVQWADDGALQAVRLLAQQLGRESCSLVLTARTGVARSSALASTLTAVAREQSAARFRLEPFSPAEVANYLDRVGEPDPGAGEVARLHRRSAGNPFYLGELLRAGPDSAGPTATVTGLVRQRLAAFDEEQRAVLELAAVIGSQFSVAVLAEAATGPPATVVSRLGPALDEGVVVFDPDSADWRFAHDLTREAILDGVPLVRRAALHGRVGDALVALYGEDADDQVDAVADHRFRAALGLPSDQAFAACSAAADRAARQLGYDRAALHRGRALACLPQGPDRRRERLEVLYRLVVERRAAGDVVEAATGVRQAIELARLVGDRSALARVVSVLGGVTLWNWRQYEQVDQATVDLIEELLAESPVDRVQLLGTFAVEQYYDPTRTDGDRHATEAVRLAREAGDAALLGRALNNYVIAAWRPGRDADRLAALDESLALTGNGLPLATEVVARLHRASLRLAAADLAGSERDLDRATKLAPRLGLLEVEGQVATQHAGISLLRGDPRAAAELSEQAYELLARTSLWGADWTRLIQLTTAARLDHEPERVCEALVAKAYEDAHRPLRWTAVLALAEAGRLDQARDLQVRWGLRSLGPRRDWSSAFAWVQAAETALLLGTPDPAAAYEALLPFQDGLAVAGTSVAVWGPVADVLGRLADARGDRVAAQRHDRQAAVLTDRVETALGVVPCWPAAVR